MGTCACRGDRSGDRHRNETDRASLRRNPGTDYVVLFDLPPVYQYLPHVPEPPPIRDFPMFVAKYDYEAHFADELSFKQGDLICIISDDKNWWYAQHQETGRKGFLPSNYVTQWKPLEDEEWYFGKMSRVEAVELLMQNVNGHGSYLVRKSESRQGDFALSLRHHNSVHHYLIQRLCSGEFYITRQSAYRTIQELIEHHQQCREGLLVNLQQPCLPDEDPPCLPIGDEWASKDAMDNRY